MQMDPAEEAMIMARRSPMLHRHGAVIIKNNQVIARGFNFRVDHFHHLYSMHAEINALVDLKKKFPNEYKNKKWIEKCRMYVVRVSSEGNHTKLSIPCKNCKAAIEDIGIPVVFYSA
jgi:deoxycytidylate deaminase